MRAVFFDADGVLNVGASFKPLVLERNLVETLNLLKEEDISFFMHSSWSLFYDEKTIEDLLTNYGFFGKFCGFCKSYTEDQTRESRIRSAISQHNPLSYVILDDKKLVGFESNQVVVDAKVGLSVLDVYAARFILEN